MKIVLGVPTLNRYDLLPKLLASAEAGTRKPDGYVIVDNGGKLRAEDLSCGTTVFDPNSCRIAILQQIHNIGVGPAWNLMARRELTSDDVRLLICGDDVVLHEDTIAGLERVMEETDADFVSALCQHNFSCFMMRARLFEKIGYFDENFCPAYFEDNDFSYRMRLANICTATAGSFEHVGSATLKAFTPEQTEEHHGSFRALQTYYIRKWGGEPGKEAHIFPFGTIPASMTEEFREAARGPRVLHGVRHGRPELIENGTLGAVLLDEELNYESMSSAIRSWLPKLDVGGFIGGTLRGSGAMAAMMATHDRLPASEVRQDGTTWWYKRRVCLPDGTGRNTVVTNKSMLYIPVVNNPEVLKRAMDSVPDDVDAVVVDQSPYGDFEKYVPDRLGYLRPSGSRMRFSQLQNYMLLRAAAQGTRELLFMHSDGSCDPSVVSRLLARARQEPDDWGVIFTHYDVLCAFNVPALLDRVGFWDETFAWYYADNDFYRRLRLSGLRAVEQGGADVQHERSSTQNFDPAEAERHKGTQFATFLHYTHKWGAEPGRESHVVPYGGP